MNKIVTIGSATMDVFVECDSAGIVSVRRKDSSTEYMSYPYGAKLDICDFDTQVGGGGINTAVNFANLGFPTSAIFKVGKDIYSDGIFTYFENRNVDLGSVIQDVEDKTGFSIILTSFEGDRTVLAHRGANAHITKSEIDFGKIKDAKLLYIAPLNGDSNKVLDDLVKYAQKNDTFVCFNAGSTGIKKGFKYLSKILKLANIVVMNKEEASMATGITIRQDTREVRYSNALIHTDLKKMLTTLKMSDYQVIVITDGKRGSYAYDGKNFYFCPPFEGRVVSTLGAGDAFASTFCAAMMKFKDISQALVAASINSAAVVSEFGATKGLLTFDEIVLKMNTFKDFTAKIEKSV